MPRRVVGPGAYSPFALGMKTILPNSGMRNRRRRAGRGFALDPPRPAPLTPRDQPAQQPGPGPRPWPTGSEGSPPRRRCVRAEGPQPAEQAEALAGAVVVERLEVLRPRHLVRRRVGAVAVDLRV